MQKKYTKHFIFLVSFLVFTGMKLVAQTDVCEDALKKAKTMLANPSPFGTSTTAFSLVQQAVETCNTPEAQNLLGLLHNDGIGTPVNPETGFELLSEAANAGYADAQFNLGFSYKLGLGCDLDHTKAIELFTEASNQGHQKAASTIGYMYYKGFSVTQDYEEAIRWFEKSEDTTLSKYYLGLCYYLGYGVSADVLKAIEILAGSESRICSTLLNHIENNRKDTIEAEVETAIEEEITPESTDLTESAIDEELIAEDIPLTEADILGEWTGQYLQYDWSGAHIESITPIAISFTKEGETLQAKATINNQEITAIVSFSDHSIYFLEDFGFELDRLYHDEIEKIIKYSLLNMQLNKKAIGGKLYVTGSVDSYIKKWEEYGRPSRVVLVNKNDYNGNDELSEEALLEALFEGQEEQFIKLYPVPFVTELNVQYELTDDQEVYAELVSLYGGTPIIIQPRAVKPAGAHTYKIPISNLPQGLYVVRLTAGNQLYTRLVTKDN